MIQRLATTALRACDRHCREHGHPHGSNSNQRYCSLAHRPSIPAGGETDLPAETVGKMALIRKAACKRDFGQRQVRPGQKLLCTPQAAPHKKFVWRQTLRLFECAGEVIR